MSIAARKSSGKPIDRMNTNRTRRPARLLEHWPDFMRRIRRARRVALFLDFDGTLAGFRRNPKEVRLSTGERRLLTGLSKLPRMTLVFISGRRRADLKGRVGVRGAAYFGLHGFESEVKSRLSAASRQSLDRVQADVNRQISGLPHVWLDDKQSSLALNYRGAEAGVAAQGRAAVLRAVARERLPLHLLRGKKILEILPPEIENKGASVMRVLSGLGKGTLPIYFGDDATDETAFAALKKASRNGGPGPVTVHVGARRTEAFYRARDIDEVYVCLSRLSEELSE